MGRTIGVFLLLMLLNSIKASSQLHFSCLLDTVEKRLIVRPLPQNFYNQNIGYFCKKELQLQKATSLPVFIRLGSKEQVDFLEQKPNAIKKD
jgi:hypothetical protein